MAHSASLGAAAPGSPFTFKDAAHLLHAEGYSSGQTPGALQRRAQYSDLAAHIQTVEQAVIELGRMASGITLLLEMLDESADRVGGNSYIANALYGLLGPMTQGLERHAAALKATVHSESEATALAAIHQ